MSRKRQLRPEGSQETPPAVRASLRFGVRSRAASTAAPAHRDEDGLPPAPIVSLVAPAARDRCALRCAAPLPPGLLAELDQLRGKLPGLDTLRRSGGGIVTARV